jgi:hypothetical protein
LGETVQSSSVTATIAPLVSFRPTLRRYLCRWSRFSDTSSGDRR